MKHKKAQGAIEGLQGLVAPLIGIAIILVIGFLIFTEVKEQTETIGSSNWCGTDVNYTYSGEYEACCNSTGCLTGYILNITNTAQCCNTTGPDCNTGNVSDSFTDCSANNNVPAGTSFAFNATIETSDAMSDIPGWLPIIVVAMIGALILGLVRLFRSE